MDCYRVKVNGTTNDYKGFAVINEKQRQTAIKWSGSEKYIRIPDELTGVSIVGWEDRMNNKILKVRYQTSGYNLLFDLYIDALVEILKYSSVIKGVIQDPLVFLDGGKLWLKNGIEHKLYLDRKEEQEQTRGLKRIPVSQLQLGHIYKNVPNGHGYIYLGKSDSGLFKCIDVLVFDDDHGGFEAPVDFRDIKTLNFKYDTNIKVSKNEILERIKKDKKENERTLKTEEERLQNKDPRYNLEGLRRSVEYFKDNLQFIKDIEDFVKNLEME